MGKMWVKPEWAPIPPELLGKRLVVRQHDGSMFWVGREGVVKRLPGSGEVVLAMDGADHHVLVRWTKAEEVEENYQQRYDTLWASLLKEATERGLLADYDAFAKAHGGPQREQTFVVTYDLPCSMQVAAKDEADALAQAAAHHPSGTNFQVKR